jgi:hypothetical protein
MLCFCAWFTFNIKLFLSQVRECDGEDGRAVDKQIKEGRVYSYHSF